jgi:hypothetical protein
MSDSASDNKTRLRQAQQFLIDHPKEKQCTAAQIYKVNKRTLSNAIKAQDHICRPVGGYNKILSTLQEQAIHGFIWSYIKHNQLLTREIIFAIICDFRKRDSNSPLSQDWLTR